MHWLWSLFWPRGLGTLSLAWACEDGFPLCGASVPIPAFPCFSSGHRRTSRVLSGVRLTWPRTNWVSTPRWSPFSPQRPRFAHRIFSHLGFQYQIGKLLSQKSHTRIIVSHVKICLLTEGTFCMISLIGNIRRRYRNRENADEGLPGPGQGTSGE